MEDPTLHKFCQDHQFCGCFRTSAKTGLNISDSMEYLLRNIIKRMQNMEEKGNNEVFSTGRKTVELDPEKHNQTTTTKRRNDKDGCC